MLKVARLYQLQLDRIMQEIAFDENFKYFINDSAPELKCTLDENSWRHLQLVSVNGEDVIGYFDAEIDRQSNAVVSLQVANFTGKPNIIFAKDFKQFFTDLFLKFNFNKVTWYVVVSNPAEAIYDKFIRKCDGRVVGVFKENSRQWNGTICDIKAYEVLRREFRPLKIW